MRLAILAAIFVAAAAAQQPARSAPFQMNQLNGRTISFSQYKGQHKGKILAVAFIFTTCPHCQDLTRVLGPLQREYAARGVQFLECAFNDDAPVDMRKFLDQFNPPFPVGWSDQAAVRAYLHYSLMDPNLFVPHMVFLDRNGVRKGDFPGESDFFKNPEVNIKAQLEKLLKSSSPPKR
jgi:thiol-disulfide isomerase/thioredoxin